MEKKSSSNRRQELGFHRAPSSSSSNWRRRHPTDNRREKEQKGEEEEERSDPIAMVGTCPDMCPAKERAIRERLRDLSVFERSNGNPAKTSPNIAIKKFCRTISSGDVQASDLRPPAVLQYTLKYLLNLLESSNHPFEVVYDFVFDRTRSIRQDLSMQKIVDDQAIHMYEEMVKFHIICHQKLARCCGESDFSSLYHLNMEQLMKCLLSLFDIYDTNRRSKSVCNNEAEFYSFYVLLRLSCKTPAMGDSLHLWFRQLPSPVLHSKEIHFSRTILRYYRIGNYRSFFNTIANKASHLQLCLMEPLFNEVRVKAISYINFCGYKLHPYPLARLSKLLMIKEKELESLCHVCGLEIITDEAGGKLLPAKQSNICLPKSGFQSYSLSRSDINESDSK
ncbi:SAC3 family protein C isoform X2 [Iris pallida]|uniref:SAC3 family protein C isoform X2 n=1 Tax=Iris pallida TaxID=29817 RepID=A0AAX6GE26_IRIPA|nr:SAC3 family protein C isoform X2 [Iris pallida]KAJ6826617.1 SAC3 family protein C isoform X2 [Iris pallida]